MSGGRVAFVGCGPGAADLLTVRAVQALARADVVVWNASLLDRQTLADHTRGDAEIVQWPPATQADVFAALERAVTEDLFVVRLKAGDPTLFGALEPELAHVRERAIPYEVVPGISALSAAAAACGEEIATPQAPLLLVDADRMTAATGDAGGVVVAYGSGRDPHALQAALLERGLAPSTPCTVAIEVSRRDEALLSCPLAELGETIEDMGRGVLTIVLAGVEQDASKSRGSD